MQLRNEIGQYGRKPRNLGMKTFLVLVLITGVLVWFIPKFVQYNALDKAGEITATSTRATLNEALQKLIKERTEEAMKDPANIKEYHDWVELRVTDNINRLTGNTLKEYINAK